jgi:transposase-like protein
MGKQRKQYQAAFKSKVALEAIKGVRTVNEIATHYGVHPTQVAQWKKQAQVSYRSTLSHTMHCT